MNPRIVVRPMPGTLTNVRWTAHHGWYWRWRCEACTNLGHWTTADNAHDDGREHARECAALKYALVAEQIRKMRLLPVGVELRTAVSELARAL